MLCRKGPSERYVVRGGNYIDILNFFDNRSTNASAESFNAKIKNFRAQLRGISDIKYLLFRLQKIYA